MEAIIVRPKNQKELTFFKEFFKKVNANIQYKEEEVAEGDVYYPELDKKIKKALQREKEGKAITHDISSFDNFLKSVREHA